MKNAKLPLGDFFLSFHQRCGFFSKKNGLTTGFLAASMIPLTNHPRTKFKMNSMELSSTLNIIEIYTDIHA